MATASVSIRPATDEDVPGIRVLLASHGNDGPIVNGDIVGPYLRHLRDHGRLLVTAADHGVLAFGAAIDTGRGWHLADLFVHPDALGRGLGRPLLAAVLDGATDRSTFASEDPRALPLYVRAGMTPLWPSLYLEGAAATLPQSAGRLTTEAATAEQIRELDRRWTGMDRPADHRFWASQVDADSFVVLDGGAVAGAGYARIRQASPVRALDRLLVHPDADPVPVILSAIRRAAGDGGLLVGILGPNPVLRPLLETGFRIADRDTYMASRPDLFDPTRLIPNAGLR